MSYILDALRKSEEERKRGDLPNPADFSQAAPDSEKPSLFVPLLVGGLIVLNLVVLLVWAPWKDATESLAAPTVGSSIEPVALPATNPNTTVQVESKAPVLPSTSPAISPPSPVVAPPITAPPITAPVTKVQQKQVTQNPEAPPSASHSVTPKPTEPAKNTVEQDLSYRKPATQYVPQLQELPARVQQNIPDMSFSSHMYSSLPRFRSITINGRRLKEGQFLNNDVGVQEITEKGVIMSYDGQFFEVDVLGRWGN